jgi:hypothetical protein
MVVRKVADWVGLLVVKMVEQRVVKMVALLVELMVETKVENLVGEKAVYWVVVRVAPMVQ